MFRKVIGEDPDGSAIESADPKDWGTTWKPSVIKRQS